MTATVTWRWLRWSDLTPDLLHMIYKARIDVFVVEQTCPYAEIDGLDLHFVHAR